jgi:hypothetical protein
MTVDIWIRDDKGVSRRKSLAGVNIMNAVSSSGECD